MISLGQTTEYRTAGHGWHSDTFSGTNTLRCRMFHCRGTRSWHIRRLHCLSLWHWIFFALTKNYWIWLAWSLFALIWLGLIFWTPKRRIEG